MTLSNKTIVLGVTGSIAAYKAVGLASTLTQEGARVEVIMTRSATEFVRPLSFQSVTKRPVVTGMFELDAENRPNHVARGQGADLLVVAPASAHTIARLAWGLADDVLSCTVLSTTAPIIVAPAMETHMYSNQATQENLERLRARGFTIVEPGSGHLASGAVGKGRLADEGIILEAIRRTLNAPADLAGRRVIVTAGGTQEPIDPVRFISNRSSGKMGYALAEAARDRGAEVTLVSAPTALPAPSGVRFVPVETALQMRQAVLQALPGCDAVIMAAAVADYRVEAPAEQKIKRTAGEMTLKLVKNPDILAEVSVHPQRPKVVVGFAAESRDLVDNARSKLGAKNLDLIVANDITAAGSGFGVDTNQVTIIARDGRLDRLPLMSKRQVADRVWDAAVALLP
ncbi:MAG: bifunctional phosphopantothenoylcysteine decarboxylase/phosphopantothenate--cysteine ligase CoaBC [Dehalococcoidia bacterium]|nr:bifunctional phosphopantothenoylcysteine decarboxylase/phosphopantothenate--cysteine ligase CoaBC [Dehalococcoidia bacterium]